ncbi:MAG: MarR family transcriptional regulator [Clostridia bacterium]|nr:MarR family transcriptional regulator [Clostridia bacterium]
MATFMKNLNRVSQCEDLFREQSLGDVGIDGYQTKYILGIDEDGKGISQDALAKKIFVNKSNVARQLARLEDKGLVRREGNPSDRRGVNVYLTDEGVKVLREIRRINADWRERVTADFTEEEKTELVRLSEKLCENATKIMDGGM